MKNGILYLGDTALALQASYLAGVMHHACLAFDYVDSETRFPETLLQTDPALVIVSDYPASNFNAHQMNAIAERVKDGMGLLMIGGWESFTGAGGDYHRTPVGDILPVTMKPVDDRVNFSDPCLVVKKECHEIIDGLPLEEHIPAIGGLNAVDAKPAATVLLSAVRFKAQKQNGAFGFTECGTYPLLVTGDCGAGRTAAFTSDVAPHWVGPFVDWGDKRVRAQADGAGAIEVGNWYAEFFANLLRWLCARKG